MIKVGVIGFGYWGPNIARNFSQNADLEIIGIAELSEKRRAVARTIYPNIPIYNDAKSLIRESRMDAVAIITPVSTHYELAKEALESGKHVLIEKPMTSSVAEAEKLIELALKKNLTLMVDHTFVYSPAVRKIKEQLDNNELGDLYYFDSVRINLGLFQQDVNVVWDLAPHDISIMQHLLNSKKVNYVCAQGASHTPSGIENIAYVTINFDNNFLAHFHVNWLAPTKIRRILIGGTEKMLVFDDVQPSEKIKIYDKGITVTNGRESLYKTLIQYRIGDVYVPNIPNTEALKIETEHFVDCLSNGTACDSDGEDGLYVVKILEAAQSSLDNNGSKIKID